jgi:phosphatidylglycerophosphate synthase
MLDGRARKIIEPTLSSIAEILKRIGLTPNQVTLAGFVLGLVAAGLIALDWYIAGLLFILVSRLADGLDGALAKITNSTDFGGYLDIVLDFAFYGAIPLAFIFADPTANALAGAVLIFSFYVNGASFLAFSTLAEKRSLSTDIRGAKSIYFTTGLAEASETLALFALACLFPRWFAMLAWLFAFICFYTTLARIVQARSVFTD